MGPAEMELIAEWIDHGVEATRREDATALDRIAGAVKGLTSTFPAPGIAL